MSFLRCRIRFAARFPRDPQPLLREDCGRGRRGRRFLAGVADFVDLDCDSFESRNCGAVNLCEKLREAGLNSKRFLFTDIEPIDPDNPAKILDKIFLTPKDFQEGTVHSFFD